MTTFISYSNADKPFARKLADALIENGANVWIDEDVLNIGDNIVQQIDEGLKSADSIIPILSKRYVKSKWAMQELSFASAKALSERSIRVIPVLIEDCDIPVFLRDRMYADFRYEFDQPFQLLLRSLQQEDTSEEVKSPKRAVRAERGKKGIVSLSFPKAI